MVYLEHAKAEEVAQVLSELSQERAGSSRGRSQTTQRTPTTVRGREAPSQSGDGSESSVIAAFDSGMRIAADENTNSLVIIANQEDFRVVSGVIRQLDIERKQVFVDAVILELSSEDTFNLGLAAHLPTQPDPNAAGYQDDGFGQRNALVAVSSLNGT